MPKPLHKTLAVAINSALVGAVATTTPTVTAAENVIQYKIPAGNLIEAINRFASKSGVAVVMNHTQLQGLKTEGLQGRYSIEQGFKLLLKGTALTARKTAVGYSIEASSADTEVASLATVEVRGKTSNLEPGGFKAVYQETATKMAMPLRETPQAISVVTRDSMDARQVSNLATALEMTAGVSNNAGTSGAVYATPGAFGGFSGTDQKFTIRAQEADIRTDGFKVTGGLGGDDGIDLAAYERIEVVRGAPGFYGRGSLGGFINKVRKKPEAEFSADISLKAGSFDTYRTEADITGILNDTKNILGQMTFAYENAGAFTEEIKNERLLLAPSFKAEINNKTSLLVQVLYQKDKYDPNPGIPVRLEDSRITTYEKFDSQTELYGKPGDKSEVDHFQAAITLNHELSESWLASLHLNNSSKNKDHIHSSYAYVYFGYVYYAGGKDIWERDSWAGELRLQGTFDAFEKEHQALFGLETNAQHFTRKYGKMTSYGYMSDFENNPDSYPDLSISDIPTDIDRFTDADNQAVYAQFMLSLSERSKLLMGARYDWSFHHTKWTGSWGAVSDEKTTDKAFTKRIGLTHEFNPNISAYGIYSESFDPILSLGREGSLDPQTGRGLEAGLKTEWFDKKFGVNLAIYRQELDNIPLVDPIDDNFFVSSGVHRTDGIELEFTGSPYLGWTVGGAASWMDNEFVESDDPNFGLSRDGSVDKQFSLYSSYEFQGGDLKGLGLGATFVNVGERKFINGGQIFLDGYNRLDLNLAYKGIPDWDMNLLVRNVTDEKYLDSVNPQLWGGSYWGAPRAVMLTVNHKF